MRPNTKKIPTKKKFKNSSINLPSTLGEEITNKKKNPNSWILYSNAQYIYVFIPIYILNSER